MPAFFIGAVVYDTLNSIKYNVILLHMTDSRLIPNNKKFVVSSYTHLTICCAIYYSFIVKSFLFSFHGVLTSTLTIFEGAHHE